LSRSAETETEYGCTYYKKEAERERERVDLIYGNFQPFFSSRRVRERERKGRGESLSDPSFY
jgi:hypothetical protein